jgi:hypothetical protein
MPEFLLSKLSRPDLRKHGLMLLILALLCARSHSSDATPTIPTQGQWGSFLKPFAADSLWNSRPVDPTFSNFEIPKSSYFPAIGTGPYSTGVFLADANDPPIIIQPPEGKKGIWDPDAGELRSSFAIPHWPASVKPATGSDGHADIIDPVSGIVHSFFQLKNINGVWTAQQYAWSPLGGTGWGDPSHHFQGARAAGVSTTAGLIRKHEINDGQPTYMHALAMSLTYNALSANPTYIYPATSADTGAEKQNSGEIPEGALVMLPPDFDTSKISNLQLRKVADTLKTYGAYVVDRNVGTPYVIYVENGSGFDLHHGGWDVKVASDLDRIRAGLRQVKSAKGWIDGNGHEFSPHSAHANVLSMRGPWELVSGTKPGVFDTGSQTLSFAAPADGKSVVQHNGNSTGLSHVVWAKLPAGTPMRFTVKASGAAKLQLVVYQGSNKVADSGALGNGRSLQFAWPAGAWINLVATSDPTSASTVSAELVEE